MKTLEIKTMEKLVAGDGNHAMCSFGIALGATIGFALGGPFGAALGGIGAGSMFCAEPAS